jgi:imidazolonepropionase-like amidohydrolase
LIRPPATIKACHRPADIQRQLERLHANGVWLCPTLGSFRGWAPRQWPSIQGGFADLARLIRNVGIPVLVGTDFGDARFTAGESLHDELELLVASGFSSMAVLRAATYDPAVFLGLTDSLGSVRPGNVADLVLLDDDPIQDIRNTRRIAAVIRGGTLLTREMLLNGVTTPPVTEW